MPEQEFMNNLEKVRSQLNVLVINQKLTEPETIYTSEKLDKYINCYYRMLLKKNIN